MRNAIAMHGIHQLKRYLIGKILQGDVFIAMNAFRIPMVLAYRGWNIGLFNVIIQPSVVVKKNYLAELIKSVKSIDRHWDAFRELFILIIVLLLFVVNDKQSIRRSDVNIYSVMHNKLLFQVMEKAVVILGKSDSSKQKGN